MKLIYSHLQKFLPDLDKDPSVLRDDLSMIGHFTNYYEEIEGEIVFDLDIKVNRGDCLGYYGLARDLSVLYNLPLAPQNHPELISGSSYQLPIVIAAITEVKRICAIKISNFKNTPSPDWLVKFLELHQVNSINTLVDLTNYVMFLYGIPNHAFDTAKSTDNLIWELNNKYPKFTTLDDTLLKLKAGILMVNSPSTPLSLSFLGGQNCAIDLTTTDTIVEMAVYDRVRVRQDSRFLKTTTEAGVRLEKDLDPELIPQAFNQLISLVLEHCGGQISSSLYDYYPNPIVIPQIKFDSTKPSQYSGVDISSKISVDILTRLGCQIITPSNNYVVSPFPQREKHEVQRDFDLDGLAVLPPSIRKDITIEEDFIEEVVRFYGYNQIPSNQPLATKQLPDITPKILYLIEQLKDQLVSLGYDEVRSWPLVQHPLSVIPSEAEGSPVYTQNSINSEYPVLRQSIIQSLKSQLDQYQRFKLPNPQFFEIGKIFYQQNSQYVEKYSLGIYHYVSSQLQKDLKILKVPLVKGGSRGIDNFVEIILDNLPPPDSYQPFDIASHAYELTSQLITLDANVNFDTQQDPQKLIKDFQSKINPDILWQIIITDEFQDPKTNQYRYTFRVTYFNCDDKTAKKIHLKAFNLQASL